MATLYEIDCNIMNLLENGFNEECIDPETGEIIEEKAKALLDGYVADRNSKIENIACYIKNLESDCNALKQEEAILKARRLSKEKKIENLKSYITQSLQAYDQDKLESSRCVVSFRKSQSVEVVDQELLDAKFIKEKIEYKPDLTLIKNAIKAGEEVVGAVLVDKKNIQIK